MSSRVLLAAALACSCLQRSGAVEVVPSKTWDGKEQERILVFPIASANGHFSGLDIFTVQASGRVGDIMVTHTYVLNSFEKELTFGTRLIYLMGYESQDVVDIMRYGNDRFYTLDPETAKTLAQDVDKIRSAPIDAAFVRELENRWSLRSMQMKTSKPDYECPHTSETWFIGKEDLEQFDVVISKSITYGNRWNAEVVLKETGEPTLKPKP
jgi:hypothetical protein